mgnify:CR=1|jgi:hypothetical protein
MLYFKLFHLVLYHKVTVGYVWWVYGKCNFITIKKRINTVRINALHSLTFI